MNVVQKKIARPSTEQKRLELRLRLLDHAEHVVATQGGAGLRARDLAEQVGCALGAVYLAFADLDEIAVAVNGRTMGRLRDMLEEVERSSAADPPGDRLERLALAYLDYAIRERPRWDALFAYRAPPGTRLPDWYDQQRDALFVLVERVLVDLAPTLPPAEQKRRARTVFSAIHGVVALGLSRTVADWPEDELRGELRALTHACAAGLGQGWAA